MTTINVAFRGITSAKHEMQEDGPRATMDAWAERMILKGNSKSRRRWRRRNVPNTQREAAIAQARAVLQRWASEGYARVRR